MVDRPGVIGLGQIGEQIVGHWVDDGHDVRVFDLDAEKIETMVEAGAVPADSSRDLAGHCDLTLILAGTGDDVEEIIFDDGVAEAASEGDVIAVASTVHPRRFREWATRMPDGIHLVDVPLTLEPFLPEREAVMFAGGPEDVIDEISSRTSQADSERYLRSKASGRSSPRDPSGPAMSAGSSPTRSYLPVRNPPASGEYGHTPSSRSAHTSR